jgi:hypothetical protein
MGRPRKEVDEKLICQKYMSGASSKKLHEEFGISVDAIMRILRKNNIKVNRGGARRIELKWSIEELKKRYESMSCGQLGKELGVPHHVVEARLKEAGVKLRGMTAFGRVNEHFFDLVDAEEKAYWLGFLAADGNVHKNGMGISLTLQERDKDHLNKFLKAIDSKAKIGVYLRKNGCKDFYVS